MTGGVAPRRCGPGRRAAGRLRGRQAVNVLWGRDRPYPPVTGPGGHECGGVVTGSTGRGGGRKGMTMEVLP